MLPSSDNPTTMHAKQGMYDSGLGTNNAESNYTTLPSINTIRNS